LSDATIDAVLGNHLPVEPSERQLNLKTFLGTTKVTAVDGAGHRDGRTRTGASAVTKMVTYSTVKIVSLETRTRRPTCRHKHRSRDVMLSRSRWQQRKTRPKWSSRMQWVVAFIAFPSEPTPHTLSRYTTVGD
jgi:hypothetical protein